MLAHALGAERGELLARDEDEVAGSRLLRFEALVDERAIGIPVAYLVGEAWFYGRRFEITRDVLVPRPETENVVEAALDDLRVRVANVNEAAARSASCATNSNAQLSVVDVGTGSGVIAVTVACEFAEAKVLGTDISASALALARRNAAAHGAEARCSFVLGDLLEPLIGAQRVDCIVANLPYVPTGEIPKPPNPVAFEPAVAVDGGPDGLMHYRRLLAQIPRVAKPDASIFLEAAPPTIDPLAQLVESILPSAHVEIVEDYSGLDRFLQISLA